MYILDSIGNLESLSIYLSRPSGEPLGCLDEYIDEQTASLVRGLNQQQELSFEIIRQDNDWYEYIQEGMYLFVETVGIFKMKQPRITYNGEKETKIVTAYSCDNELEDKNIDLEINMGTKTSQEYLVEYTGVDTNEELINPYTGIPYDWIVLYNMFPEQLKKHLTDYNSRYFGTPDPETGDIIVTEREKLNILNDLFTLIPRLKNKFAKSYDAETGSENYTLVEYADVTYNPYTGEVQSIILYKGYNNRVSYLIDFYTRNREKLSLLCLVLEETHGSWTVGDVYGVSDGDYSLANKKFQFDISENIYSFLATNLAQTTECMVTFDISNRKVNIAPVETIGENTGITISYDNLLNQLDIEPNEDNLATRLVVKGADDLSIEQVNFGLEYIDDITYKLNAVDENGKRIYVKDALATKYMQYINYRESKRERYIQLSKDYSNYLNQITEIKYRVPADDLKTDWGTFTSDELSAMLTVYKNLLVSLISMYRSDYYPEGFNNDDSVNENFIKNTIYWYDYYAYQNIITEIECAISVYPYYSDQDKWSEYFIILYSDAIKAWETEWSLFGTIELQAKIDTYKANMDLLAESSVIRTAQDEDTIKEWDDLTDAEKTSFGNLEANYQYDNYMDNYNNMISAQEYLETLLDEISDLEAAQNSAQEERVGIVQSVQLESYFTEDECKIISMLYRDADCTNENILVTSIDSSDEKIDTMKELLEYGQEQLSIMSRPQLNFSINSDNLLSLVDYKEYWSDFKVGNYLMVQYRDDTFIKLRMIGYKYNPCLPSDGNLEITFSNIIRSKVGVTDLESLLGLSSVNSSSNAGSSGSGTGGNYGESDDIDVTISNTMLSKLLNSETFGTRVKDVILNTIDVNSITARYATFNGLANGVTIIDGNCITTGVIRDLVYKDLVDRGIIQNGSVNNTSGSVINLNNGYFSLAGGKIKYNGSLVTIDSDVVIGGQETVSEVLGDIEHAQQTADGKTKVYYGSPSAIVPPTYTLNQGDYLVDSTDGSTYRWDVGTTSWIVATDYASAIEDAIEELEEEIIIQIDGKIETWTQSTNPATAWDTDELRKKHNSDLWYYTGIDNLTVDGVTIEPSKTYKYNYSTGKWSIYNSPTTSLFDFADGKTTIYYGTTSGTYANVEDGDYLIDSTDGCTYKYSGTTHQWVKVTDYVSAIQAESSEIYDAIGALEEDLEEQIDAKIETWVQNTNPASSWDSSTLPSHDGDLWYYNGITTLTVDGVSILPSKTYQYNATTGLWVAYNSPSRSLFDLADGKSTIYYGTTSGTYANVEVDDYLVDSTDGCTYKWNGTAWVKVTDYSSSISGAINDLRDELEGQIDAKIETWAQTTDPALSWNATDYESHDGDLWLYTGLEESFAPNLEIHPHGIYQFHYYEDGEELLDENGNVITDESGNDLSEENSYYYTAYSSSANNLFDLADGKATIYYGSKDGTYSNVEIDDYLVDSSDGSTYRWDGSVWLKVTDYNSDISEAVSALEATLEAQIDGKVETWAQSTNPALGWDSGELESHDGDLWYYTGTSNLTVDNVTILPSKTYQYDYDTGLWVLYNSPSKSLFDLADGKSTIYYGTPSGSYPNVEVDDYLVDATDGSTYKWTGSSWSKVTDYASSITNSINSLRSDLEAQIDGKVETWAQSTNPALGWTDLKPHDGDLWLYTGLTDLVIDGVTIHPQGTYKFIYSSSQSILDESGANITDESGNDLSMEIGYKWQQYSSVSSNIFDKADGKSTIYYGSTGNTYTGVEEGDYLVDSQKGTTYRYTGGQWVAVTKTGGLYATCDSVASAKEKIVVCNESISVYEGLTISVKFANANTYYGDNAPLTLNVGKLGVKNVYYNGEVISSTNRMYWSAGATIMFMYDGEGWIVIGHPQSYQGSCSTGASTTNKNCSIADAVIVKGTVVNIAFTNTNSASSATLNVIDNTTNAPTIVVDSSNNTLSSSSQYNWNAGATVGFTFDGRYWRMNETSALYNTNSYMRFESAYGLMIANMTGGVVAISSVTTPNTLLTSTELQIRNGQTVLAKYGSSIELAGNGASVTIGSTSSYNTYITSSSLLFRYGSSNKQLLKLEYDTTNSVPSLTLGNTDGYNTLVNNTGVIIRTGTTSLASFGSSINIYKPGTNTAVVTIDSNGGSFTGAIYANTGYIGGSTGFVIDSQTIRSYDKSSSSATSYSITLSRSAFTRDINGVSRSSLVFAVGDTFGIDYDGWLYASHATINGVFTSTSDSNGYYCKIETGTHISFSRNVNGNVTDYGDFIVSTFNNPIETGSNYSGLSMRTFYNEILGFAVSQYQNSSPVLAFCISGFQVRTMLDFYAESHIYLTSNNKCIYQRDTGGTYRLVLQFNSNNNCVFNYGGYDASTTSMSSGYDGNIYGRNVNLLAKKEAFMYANYGVSGQAGVVMTTNGNFRPTSDNTSQLGVSGNRWKEVYAAKSTINTSDRKEKDNIKTLEFSKEFIMALNPVEFMWKNGDHRRKNMGFIAQELADVCKLINQNLSVVTASYKHDGTKDYADKEYFGEDVDDEQLIWGTSYAQFIAPTISVVQDHELRIQQLESENEQLRNRIIELEK